MKLYNVWFTPPVKCGGVRELSKKKQQKNISNPRFNACDKTKQNQ